MKSTPITLTARYMILPINPNGKRKRICLYDGDTLLWDFDAPIDFRTPHHHTYMDIGHLQGKTVTLTSIPQMDLDFDFCDEIPPEAGAAELYRPLVHFTARLGWTNDPNGLVYVNGVYHMFFQHNPADSAWGNMTWGHAVSADLLRWEQLDSALLPDALGTMFSGSGIIDHRNVSGLGSAENPPVLFYYTAAGGCSLLSAGQPTTQCMAYSTDGGKTLHKYAQNPVIDHIIGGNRDPKVIWCDELDRYILALYMDGNQYAIFTSSDLLTFRELQRLTLAGDAECPDVYPLTVEGSSGERKWVYSGASDRYVIGEFRDGRFHIVQESFPYAYGRDKRSYAAQTFSDIEDRRIKIAWERFHAPGACFESQMSIPTEVSLCRVGEEYRLRTRPCREFETLHTATTVHAVTSNDFTLPLEPLAYDMTLTLDADSPDVALRFFGYEFTLRPSTNTCTFGGDEMPLSLTGTPARVRILADVLGCELFADDGLLYGVYGDVSDYGLRYLTITTLDPARAPQAELTVHALQSIFNYM